MLALRSVARAYDGALARRPVVVKGLSSCAIVGAADAMTQLWGPHPYDATRTAIVGVGYGGLWFAPVMHAVTVKLWGRYVPSTAFGPVLFKTAVDMAVFFPVNMAANIAFQALSRDRERADPREAVARNLAPAVSAGWAGWPLITFAIYSGAVPQRYRVLAMNACSFAWNGYMVSRFEAA